LTSAIRAAACAALLAALFPAFSAGAPALPAPAPASLSSSGGMAGADALLAAGQDAEAARAYGALGAQSGAKREGWRQNNWGLALLRLGKPAASVDHFQTAVDVDPSNFIARANLGAAWERVGDLTKAVDVYRRALELVRSGNRALARGRSQPDADEEAHENLAAPAPQNAVPRLLEKDCPLSGDALKSALARANALLDKGLYAQAGAAYAALGRTAPPERESWRLNNWALCYLRLSDPSSARERLERAVQAFPANRVAWNNLAMAYEQLGQTDLAEMALARGSGGRRAFGSDPQRLELVRLKLAFAAERKRWESLRR
jgi:tetratricopeptide (TPR) repeat protein